MYSKKMMKSLEDAPIVSKKILLRLGLDLPLDDHGKILDDSRLRSSLETIHYLLNRHAKVVIIGHLGRPKGRVDSKLSLRPVYLHLSALLKKPVHFAPNLFSPATKTLIEEMKEGMVVGLENLRFDSGEENNSRTLAKKLAGYGEVYVNDAFSAAHREAASIVAITEFLPSYPGLLFEREVAVLHNLMKHPERPFIAIIGGVKVADKLPAIKYIADNADRVLVGGAVANTFLAAKGMNIRESIIDREYVEQAKDLAQRFRDKLVLPEDFVWEGGKILDSGSQTIKKFQTYLKNAKTIFWNGSLGHSENPQYARGSDSIAKYIADLPATTIIAGGNTIEIFSRLKLLQEVNFVSTGGGATLGLLSGKILPGVAALD